MEIYIMIGFIWLLGWMYSCGVHSGNKDTRRELGIEKDKSPLDFGGSFQYVVLLFFWPNYLGYVK
jgi:hypothetical protein